MEKLIRAGAVNLEVSGLKLYWLFNTLTVAVLLITLYIHHVSYEWNWYEITHNYKSLILRADIGIWEVLQSKGFGPFTDVTWN